jgi:MFS family permease
MLAASAKSQRFDPLAWTTLAIFCGFNLQNYLDRYVMSGVLTPLQRDLRLDDGDAGWAASAFMLGYFLSAPMFGYLGDRFPRKYLMIAGVVAWSAATAASGLAQNFAELFSIRIFVGIGEAAFVTMGPSWIADMFSPAKRNTALTLFYVAIPFGSAIGFTLGGWFAERGDWRHAFFYAGAPGILLAMTLLFLREPKRGEADGESGALPRASLDDFMGLFRNRRYQLLVWGYTAQTFSIGAFGLWGPAFLHRVHGLPVGEASTLFGAMLAGAGLFATLLGGLTATWLHRRMASGYVAIMAFSIVAAVPVCFFALTVGSATLSLVGLGLSMFLLFLPTGPVTSEIMELVPIHLRASAVALCTFVMHLFGDWGSPTLVGYVSDWSGSLQKGVLILPFVLIIGAVFWCLLLRLTREPIPVEK